MAIFMGTFMDLAFAVQAAEASFAAERDRWAGWWRGRSEEGAIFEGALLLTELWGLDGRGIGSGKLSTSSKSYQTR
jgi:hypothetical protein